MKTQKGYLPAQAHSGHGAALLAWLGRVIHQLQRWQKLASQRRHLATLSDAALKDMGLSRVDVFQESERPFWDDPCRK